MSFAKLKTLIYTGLYAFLFIKLYLILLFKGKKAAKKFVGQTSVRWGRQIIKLLNIKVEAINIDKIPKEPVLIVSNHQGTLDIPLILGYLTNTPAFVAKKELRKLPVVGRWMKIMGCVFLDRSSARKALFSFKDGAKYIASGQSIVIFPEGTRNKEIIPFKKGSLRLALMAGVPILPVTVIGTDEVDYSGKQDLTIKIVVNDPYITSGLSNDEKNVIHEKVRDIIIDTYNKYNDK